MIKKYLALILTIIIFSSLNAQEKIKVNLFSTTDDYISKSYSDTSVALLVKEISAKHIWIKKFIDEKSGAKKKKAQTSWAIEYKGNTYFNLGYSLDLNNWKLFIRLDVEGNKYCLSFIDENAPKAIKNSGTNYGGGLQGALLKDSNKWGKSWINKYNQKVKILFIDLEDQTGSRMNRNKGSIGNLLKRNDLKEKFELEKAQIKNMTFEEVLEIIASNNK